jgi:LmbE family N-acetylglucosaminyl deacetylase
VGPPLSTDLAVPRRALAVGAHPDDVEFGCGATLAKWAAAGCEVIHLVCTDGSKGSWEPGVDPGALAAARREEARAASLALGARGEVVFLGAVDGELEASPAWRRELCGWIRRLRPEVVLGHDPWRRYRLHPDHRHAGFLVTDALVAARDPLFFPGEATHRPSALLLFEAEEPNHVEEVSAFLQAKLDALLCHRSQLRSTMGIDDPASEEQVASFRDRVLRRSREDGGLAGLPAGEAFRLVDEL